jgi:hypothetical protein
MVWWRSSNDDASTATAARSKSLLLPLMMMTTVMLVLPQESSSATTSTQECGVYLAPSTIPGAGLGMFAGNREYQKGDVVTDGDLMIPVFELDWHNGNVDFPFLWDEYVWNAGMFDGMEQEVEDIDNMHVCSPGMGAAVNCMMNLVNVDDEDESYAVSTSTVDSGESPGAGAFTPYHGRKFAAKKRIEAGSELYASYGQSYFMTRNAYREVPVKEHFRTANTLSKKFQNLRRKVFRSEDEDESDDDAIQSSLWQLARDIVRTVKRRKHWRRLLNALPENVTYLEAVMQDGGAFRKHYNESIRSLDWLEEHGQCMDNIKDGISPIPNAGRGAFANRFIPKGGLVAPSPLIQLPYRRILVMYDGVENEEGKLERVPSKRIHNQLLLNYCFGHADTTMLFCPYGLMTALINHGYGEKANTKIQWSQSMRHLEWRNQTIKSFEKEFHSGLSFDFVATRDIREDEEILIDYGDEWEAAWQRHMRSFIPQRPGYMPAFELNNHADLQILTMEEYDYDFEGIHTYCWNFYLELGGLKPLPDDKEVEYSPCRVIKRNHNDSYVAELWDVELSDFERVKGHNVVGIMWNVPRDAFYFMDSPYTRDHHQTWSFRHAMGIPDEMLPEIWKNINKTTTTKTTSNNSTGDGLPSQQEDVAEHKASRSHDPIQEEL